MELLNVFRPWFMPKAVPCAALFSRSSLPLEVLWFWPFRYPAFVPAFRAPAISAFRRFVV